MKRSRLGAIVAATACVGFVTAQPAIAVTYEPAPPFCEGAVVHDYLAPLKRMRKLHSPPATGRIGFGPASLRLKPLSALLVGEGTVGYKLFRLRGTPAPKLDWDVTTSLTRVDWQGRVLETIAEQRRHLGTVSPRRNAGATFSVDETPARYRVRVIFHDEAGHKLGGYGIYFRVVMPTRKTQLSLNSDSYSPEQTVFGRIENFGTAIAFYGAHYAIERLEGSTWIRVPESPRSFILPLYIAGSGQAGTPCSPFWIPPSMTPGRYRMSKEIHYESGRSARNWQLIPLAAEFDLTG